MSEEKKKLFDKVFQSALSILDYSVQTEKILFDKLVKKEYPEDIIREVLDKLKELNLLNDIEYCKNAVNFLVSNKNFGQKKINAKLRLKGLDKELIKSSYESAVENLDGEEELIKMFIKKNSRPIKRLFDKNELQKIRYKLYSNGFSSSAINKTMKELFFIMKEF